MHQDTKSVLIVLVNHEFMSMTNNYSVDIDLYSALACVSREDFLAIGDKLYQDGYLTDFSLVGSDEFVLVCMNIKGKQFAQD